MYEFPPCGECNEPTLDTSYGRYHLRPAKYPHKATAPATAEPERTLRHLRKRIANRLTEIAHRLYAHSGGCAHPQSLLTFISSPKFHGYVCPLCDRKFATLESDDAFALEPDPETEPFVLMVYEAQRALS